MRKLLFLLFLFGAGLTASGQSTFGTMNGTVHDPSGAVIPNATVVLHREETNTDRSVSTGDDGTYNALNLDPGTYRLRVSAAGFAPSVAQGIHLDTRQQLRFDVTLTITGSQTVTVNAEEAGTINTDNAAISASLSPEAVLDLPANYRGSGSTSPLNVVQTLPGVQPDSASYPPSASSSPSPGVKFSLQGGLPSQAETTVDGISAQNQTNNNVQADAFPSAESIAEVRVDAVNNNAEYGQPGEITTVTKAGTSRIHGSVFEYHQNRALDAIPYQGGAPNPIKPQKIGNDFGATIGGPLVIPHLYNGRDRTFFFGTYEGFRFPLDTVLQARVPTVLMKQGDFSQEVGTGSLRNPFTGGTYPGAHIPSISPSAKAFLQFYPDPNVDANLSLSQAIADNGYNYLSTRRQDINSNQFDVRIDQNFGQKLTVFARYTFKDISQLQPADLTLPYSNAIGNYRIFATSANYAFTPHLADEFRFGFTLEEDGRVNPFNGAAAVQAAGFQGLPPSPFFNGLSHIGFNDDQITAIGYRLNSTERSRIFQYVDNLTWQHGPHVVRIGADIRQLRAITVLGFTSGDNYGNFFFNPAGPTSTGQEFADFLLGVPYQTQLDNVNADNKGTSSAYAFYGQDNWKALPNLNITFGLRYEYHPPFSDPGGNIGNFDPTVAKSGRLIYPAGHADRLNPEELANFNACATPGVNNPYATNLPQNGAPCTPVVDNVAAGLPAGLRTAPKLRFEPRLGFAWRPTGNDKTVISGGAGYYNITTTGAIFYALTGSLQAGEQTFNNTNLNPDKTGPAIVFPNVSTAGTSDFASGNFTPSYGTGGFYASVDTNWHDPYSLQTNLSVERDLGRNFGLRVSYVGLKTWHLVWQPERNQLPVSSTIRSADQPRSAFPFPNFYQVQSRNTEAQATYHSGQVELTRRFSRGFSFSSTYTLAKNLADNQGTYGASNGIAASFSDEQGGYNPTDSYNRQLDYGNVTGTRRHRWLTTTVYELPVGRGKRFGTKMNRAADLLVGGWQLSGIFVDQTGPFLNAFLESGFIDPAGTGSGTLFFRQMRPDRVGNPNFKGHNRNQWVNTNAFACPGGVDSLGNRGYASLTHGACAPGTSYTDPVTGNQIAVAPIGRYGTESVGDIVGPGTLNLSTGLSKSFLLTEDVKLRAEGTFTNVLNHTNLADPNLDLSTSNFGQITQARGSDFGGNRTGQVSLRLEF